MTDPLFHAPETFMGVPAGLPGPGCQAAVLGVPFDCGTHPFHIGARQGPTEVRRQSRLIRRYHPMLADLDVLTLMGVVDCGNVVLTPGRIEDALPRIEAAAGRVLEAGAVPVGIGGDGSVSLPLMRAAARRHPGLVALHIDSHTDAYPYTPEDRFNASTQFTLAAEEGLVDASRSWHVGVRGFTYCGTALPRPWRSSAIRLRAGRCTSAGTWTSSIRRSHQGFARRHGEASRRGRALT